MYNKEYLIVVTGMKMLDVIQQNPYFMLMLEHFGIDLVVSEKTIDQICTEYNINLKLFLSFANLFNGTKPSFVSEYSFDDINNIIKYLKNCHQYYLEESYPKIRNYIQQMYQLNNQSEIEMVESFFNEYFKEVKEHLSYENNVVFPYTLNLYNKLKEFNTDTVKSDYSVVDYIEHHDDIEEKLADLKNLLLKYLPPKNDQQIRRKLLFSLFELEYDLHIHSQIEEAILIPLVEQMEQKLIQR